MAYTDKGTVSSGFLSLALATENPVRAKLAPPLGTTIVSFSTDVADGTEAVVVLVHDSVTPATGGSPGTSNHQLTWPANVIWDARNKPNPRADAGCTAVFKFLRDAAAGVYYGRMIIAGAA